MKVTDAPKTAALAITVTAAFRQHPKCCPDAIEPGERMVRVLPGAVYVHERCAR